MPNLQYIGARYVPKFYENPDTHDTTWKSSVAYEPLTVVTYNDDTYTSKITVPATVGNPSANPTYWAKTAAYNAAIAALTQTVNDLSEKVDALGSRRVMFIGDSYGDGTGEWYDIVTTALPLSFPIKIINGGRGFTGKDGAPSGTPQGVNYRWITMLQNWISDNPNEDLNSITDVFIIGGFNDIYSSYSTILSYMSAFFTYAKSNLPKAKFYLGMAGWCDAAVKTFTTPNDTFNTDDARFKLVNRVARAYAKCSDYGCAYIGDLFNCLHNYGVDFDSSGYHPSSNGEAKLATAICNAVLGGEFHVIEDETETKFIDGNNVEYTPFAARMIDNVVTITNRRTNWLAFTPDSNGSPLVYRDTGYDLKSGLVGGKLAGFGLVSLPCIVQQDDDHSNVFTGELLIDDSDVHFIPHSNIVSGTQYNIQVKTCTLLSIDC